MPNMTFRVVVTDPAMADMEEATDFMWEVSPIDARRWLSDCWDVIDSLKDLPLRHPLIPESDALGLSYRSIHVHRHRVIYRVDEQRSIVYVVRVYHGARKPLHLADI